MSTAEPKVNAWIYLREDDPAGSSYKTPGSSYQNLIDYKVYNSTDMVSICWVNIVPTSDTTVPRKGKDTTYTVQLEDKIHPDGSTNQQYMEWLIQDARQINPDIKVLVMLGYGAGEITQIFSGPQSGWQQAADAFAANLLEYLRTYGLDGFDVDWESPLSDPGNSTPDQFKMLFTAIRKAFDGSGKRYLLTLSPAAVGTLDPDTINNSFDFVNLQLYSGFTDPKEFTSAGIDNNLLAYGAKFEPNSGVAYQTAQQAAAFYAPSWYQEQLTYDIFTTWRLNSGNFQYEQAQQMILYQLVNGVAGSSFDDASIIGAAGNPPISHMEVRSGEVLDAIKAINAGSFQGNPVSYELLQHGGDSGSAHTIALDPGDPITTISGFTGSWFGWSCVLQITLTTKSNKAYGPYGTMANASYKTPFTHTAPPGQSLVAFRGSTVNVPLAGGGTTDIIATLEPVFGADHQIDAAAPAPPAGEALAAV